MAHAQNTLYITVGDRTETATLADNTATRRLTELLSAGAVTIDMSDYGGFEKVGSLPWSLPTSDRQISTVPGDIMLYLGNNIVFFYGTNSWAYTPLGKFDRLTASELKQFLSGSRVNVRLSLTNDSGVDDVVSDDQPDLNVTDLSGRPVDMTGKSLSDLPEGFYIVNGQKRLIRH